MSDPAVVTAFDASSGAVYLFSEGSPELTCTSGEWSGEDVLTVSLDHEGSALGELRLGPRLDGIERGHRATKGFRGVRQVTHSRQL